DRPFTESERQFLAAIRDWGKKIVVVINKIDILESPDDREQVRAFVAEGARSLLGTTPEVFSVSARRALAAKLEARTFGRGPTDAGDAAESGFARLERFVTETLDDEGRVRLKLKNPLGVGKHLAEKYRAVARDRLDLLAKDVAALGDVEGQLGAYVEDMNREFRFRLADVDNVLHELERRGIEYFDETMRLARVFDLLNRARLKAEFERKVIGDTARRIDEKVSAVIDWMVDRDLRQWKAVMEHVEQRREVHADRIVGKVFGGFETDRARLLDTVGRAARRAVDTYDQQGEASRMADAVQGAVASTALVEVSALGLGAAVTLIASSTFIDVTGILAAGVVAALGLFVIPSRRRRAKNDLANTIGDLRRRLMEALTGQFGREIEASEHRIREAVAPYTRFVRAETDRLEESRDRLGGLAREFEAIQEELGASASSPAAVK
ncbi:MAG: dynamin, partial [Vicinamibacteria bacterium]